MLQKKTTRTLIADLPEKELSDEQLGYVSGGMATIASGAGSIPRTTLSAHGTSTPTNTAVNGCHDSDSEWDYSPL